MPTRQYKPTSPGRRFQSVLDFRDLRQGTGAPAARAAKRVGRSQCARAHDQPPSWRWTQAALSVVDFRRNKDIVPAKVAAIEYDPNRSARLALLTMRTARNATCWRQPDFVRAIRSRRVKGRTSSRATRWRCARYRPGRWSTISN